MSNREYPEITFPCPRPPAIGREQRTLWCDACGKQVHNLSALSVCEQSALLAAQPNVCVSYRRPRSLAPAATTAALMLALAASAPLAAQIEVAPPPPSVQVESESPPPPPEEPEQVLMGAIFAPPPEELESVFLEAEPLPEPEVVPQQDHPG